MVGAGKHRGVLALRLAPLVVLIGSLLTTAVGSAIIRDAARDDDEARFEAAVKGTTAAVERRVDEYVAILRATAGMFARPEHIDAQSFRAFVSRLQLRDVYRGTLGIGYATRVEPEAVESFNAAMRHEVPDYTVWPGAPETMFPIKYIEPLDDRNRRALGYDMFSDPVRRKAMERARDSGAAAASDRVRLVQELGGGAPQPGFLIYVPVYSTEQAPPTTEDRGNKIIGFAYAPLRIVDFLEALYYLPDPAVAFRIFDGSGQPTADNFLYDSDPNMGPDEDVPFHRTVELEVAGHPWTFVFTPREPLLADSDTRVVPYIAGAGVALSLVFFGITMALSRAVLSERRVSGELAESRDELRDLAARFRVAIKNAPIIVYNTDLDLRYSWIVNVPRPWRPEDVLGKRDDELLPPADAAEILNLKTRVLRSGVGLRREIMIRIKGEENFFDLTIEPLNGLDGRLTGLTVAAVDVTNLRRAYEQFRLASLAVRSLIYDWDLHTGRVSRSEGLRDVLGFHGDEAGDALEWWEDRVHPEDADLYAERIDEAVRHGERYVIEYRVRHRDGHWVDVIDSGIVVRDAHGRATRLVGNATNISDRKEAERTLARHAEQLARSNTDLQDFAYIASHDLKEPLRGIANYAKFLEEDQGPLLGPEGRERVETIRRLSQHMYALLDSLLEYSRVGRTDLAVVDVDVGEIVDDVVSGLEPWLEQESGTVRVVGDLPVIRADRVRIGQVFSNLITNGVKYSNAAEKLVEIGCVEGSDPPVLFVRDNGIGIPERHLSKLFHMFKRLHPRTHFGGGTGSGLAIVKKIVERHGGQIWLESEPGRGTAFFFRFGTARVGDQSAARTSADAEAASPG